MNGEWHEVAGDKSLGRRISRPGSMRSAAGGGCDADRLIAVQAHGHRIDRHGTATGGHKRDASGRRPWA